MKKILILITLIVAVSCINQDKIKFNSDTIISNKSKPKNYDDTLVELEKQARTIELDSLGILIGKINFAIKTDNLKDYEKGKIPWIRIDSPQNDIKNLIAKDETVISEKKVTIFIDYPLTNLCKFELSSNNGFTRAQLINEISKRYYQLYDEEERTATIKTVPLKDRKIYNRNQTNGKYGIWGHDIGDLVLDKIYVYKTSAGEIFLTLEIES